MPSDLNKAAKESAKLITQLRVAAKGDKTALKAIEEKEKELARLQEQLKGRTMENVKSSNELQQMDDESFKDYTEETFGEETAEQVSEYEKQDVPMSDMKEFLSDDGNAPTTSLFQVNNAPDPSELEGSSQSSGGDYDAFNTSFPNVRVLSWWELGFLATNPTTIFLWPTFLAMHQLAKSTGHSFGLGINGSAGAGGGFTLGAGVVFLPTGDVGVYGGASVNVGCFASFSGTLAVTHVFGGINSFSGTAIGVFAGGGELVVGQGTLLFAASLPVTMLGYVIEVGLGAGLSAVEVGVNLGHTGVVRQQDIDKLTAAIRRRLGQ